jgi:hypothetical protein
MATMIVSGSVSTEQVAKAIASQRGSSSPAKSVGDSFHVGTLMFRARVDVETGDQTTTIKVVPFGLTFLRVVNALGIVRKIEKALQESELHAA